MPRWLNAQVCDLADLKLKEIEVALRKIDPHVSRPTAVEAAILAVDLKTVARHYRERFALVPESSPAATT
ncbi:MAG TPA: hypothetical protein VNE39_18410 [Planctomycetota bacterium]|nr:hypothetical protein [Planctomycetota bacterium]